MNKLEITATDDIPNEHISSLIHDIGSEKCYDSNSRVMMFSTQPPSFIEIIGDIISWKAIFVASATVFFSTISKRLAEDIYDNKKLIGEALFSPVRLFTKAVVKFIKETPRNSFVKFEITAPEGIPNPVISFLHESEEEIAFKISCFYAVSDRIIEKLIDISEKYEGNVTPPYVRVSDKGEVTVRCCAGFNNDHIVFTISLLD